MEDVPLTKDNYPIYLRAGGNFPRDQCSVRTGVQRAGVRLDDGMVVMRDTIQKRVQLRVRVSSKNSKANRIETMKGPAESGEILFGGSGRKIGWLAREPLERHGKGEILFSSSPCLPQSPAW
jgi:hypothetical protein